MSDNMNKSDLIDKVARTTGLPLNKSELAINTLFAAISQALAAGRRVELRGFGSFTVKDREGRIGRNPKTGEDVNIAPKRTPHFKVGKVLKDVVK